MGDVTHPNFKRKARGKGYTNALRALTCIVKQADLDRLKERARHEGRGLDEIAADALLLYLETHEFTGPNPIPLKP